MQQILNLLQMNLFEKWCIHDLVHGRSTEKIHTNPDQLSFIMRFGGFIVVEFISVRIPYLPRVCRVPKNHPEFPNVL